LRKTLVAAAVTALAVSVAGVAYAQTPAAPPQFTVDASVAPTTAGTKKKPKATTFKLKVTNNVSESKATASTIKITFPSTLKLSTKGLKQCTKSDDAILASPKAACKGSIAGKGTSHAIVNPYANPANITFNVTPIVGKNELIYYLQQAGGSIKAVLHGKIKGSTQTIVIPTFLQQPAPGVYSALADLSTTISLKKGKNSLVTSRGCKKGGHSISVTEHFVPNPTPPQQSDVTNKDAAPCKA
jgi:hypothetical protein